MFHIILNINNISIFYKYCMFQHVLLYCLTCVMLIMGRCLNCVLYKPLFNCFTTPLKKCHSLHIVNAIWFGTIYKIYTWASTCPVFVQLNWHIPHIMCLINKIMLILAWLNCTHNLNYYLLHFYGFNKVFLSRYRQNISD